MKKNFIYFSLKICIFFFPVVSSAQQQVIYELTCWHFKDQNQEKMIDTYLKNALLPAYHRKGIGKVGVFKAIANDTASDKTIWVLVMLKDANQLLRVSEELIKDKQYLKDGSEYLNTTYKEPPYTRMENIILKAFPLAPTLGLPHLNAQKQDRIYELRSYEGPTENLFLNKVKMFNAGGEIALFKRLNFNAIFYASVISGCRMPNLMYMTSFENRPDRDAHWKAFSSDTTWKKLSADPQYQHNVSHIDDIFLHPAEYSDF